VPTAIALPEHRVLLRNVSWETYERLLSENVDVLGTRFAYDEGLLEIIVVSYGHEEPNRSMVDVIVIAAEETGTDYCPAGSTTFRRRDLEKGFEPDSCYYFAQADKVRGKDKLDLAVDPPPELVIEVDITRSSLDRFRIFAAVGVSEVWRYDGERVAMFRLANGEYTEVGESIALPLSPPQRSLSSSSKAARRNGPNGCGKYAPGSARGCEAQPLIAAPYPAMFRLVADRAPMSTT
jgi:Uma2 family endonuclease